MEPVKLKAVAEEAEAIAIDMDVYIKAEDLDGREFSRTWLVEDLIEKGRVYEVFGRWKEGKTLVVMDMTAHCCLDRTWAGRRVEKALVIYVAGEAVEDIEMRLAAWRLHNEIQAELPFYIRTKPVYLTDKAFATLLAAEIEILQEKHPGLPVILVVDTLARNFGPGKSENSDEGMGAFANNIIDLVVRPTKSTGLVVHHSGHGDSERSRGHSLFAAAIDGTIKVAMEDEVITMSSVVMRSSSGGDSLSFRVAVEVLPGADNFGKAVKAPVLEYDAEYKQKKTESKNLGKTQKKLIELLRTLHQEHQQRIEKSNLKTIRRVSKTELKEEAMKRDLFKTTNNFYVTTNALTNRGIFTERQYPTTGETVYMEVTEDMEDEESM